MRVHSTEKGRLPRCVEVIRGHVVASVLIASGRGPMNRTAIDLLSPAEAESAWRRSADRGRDGCGSPFWRKSGEPAARIGQRLCEHVMRLLALAVVLAGLSGAALAQDEDAARPPNSHPERYGSGWECDWGYQEEDGTCVAVNVPANAYLTPLGASWECRRGFRRESRGFGQDNDVCVPIKVPAHGYLDVNTFNGWSCEIGYRDERNRCVDIVVPENAHAYPLYEPYGPGWKCMRGYRRDDTKCVEVQVPAHAFLTAAGDDWKCERGYEEVGHSCVEFHLPKNAHIDYSGNDWDCNSGYVLQGDQCVLPRSDS